MAKGRPKGCTILTRETFLGTTVLIHRLDHMLTHAVTGSSTGFITEERWTEFCSKNGVDPILRLPQYPGRRGASPFNGEPWDWVPEYAKETIMGKLIPG